MDIEKDHYTRLVCYSQPLPIVCCALPPNLQRNRDTLIEQSNILLKQSVNIICYVDNILALLHCDIIIDTIE